MNESEVDENYKYVLYQYSTYKSFKKNHYCRTLLKNLAVNYIILYCM